MTNMTQKSITAADAKAHLSEAIRAVERGEVVVITRYGKPVAALVSVDDLKQLEALRSCTSSGLGGLAGRWDDGDELASALDAIQRDPSVRPLPELK